MAAAGDQVEGGAVRARPSIRQRPQRCAELRLSDSEDRYAKHGDTQQDQSGEFAVVHCLC
jgi:hypothetical protein